jgi:aspartyl-tRNA(Asn)/glutamyl-tRNA(Gln) amidotransferase subunit C
MTKISKEEVLRLAAIAQLEIKDSEIDVVAKQLEDVLNYAIRVTEIAADVQDVSTKNVNVFREDLIKSTDPELVRVQAPLREQDFFVVPAVLDNEK